MKHITPVACQSVLMLGKALTFAQIEVYQALVPKAFQYWIKKCEVSLSSGYEPKRSLSSSWLEDLGQSP